MMRLLVFFAFALLVTEGAVEAYQSVGSHIRRSTDAPRNLRNNDNGSAVRAANYLGRCVAEGRGRFAREVLAMELGGEDQAGRMDPVIGGGEECMEGLGVQLRADAITLVGGMAEYYLLDVYAGAAIAAAAGDAGPAPRNGFEHLGQCVAGRNAEGIMALIDTEPASDDETAAARALAPDLGPCVPTGETIGLTPRAIRAMTAVGLYRRLVAGEPNMAGAAE